MNSTFKVLSQHELNKIVGGETLPMPTVGGPCSGSGAPNGMGGGPLTGSSGPTLSNGDSPGVASGVVTSTKGDSTFYPCSPPIIKIGPLF